MVHPRRRALDPAEATRPDHVVPRDGNLRVAAVDVGRGQFVGDAFLTRVDDVSLNAEVFERALD